MFAGRAGKLHKEKPGKMACSRLCKSEQNKCCSLTKRKHTPMALLYILLCIFIKNKKIEKKRDDNLKLTRVTWSLLLLLLSLFGCAEYSEYYNAYEQVSAEDCFLLLM